MTRPCTPVLKNASFEIEARRPGASPMEIADTARAADAHAFVSRRAAACDTRPGENGGGLSGGDRQRISIARALPAHDGIYARLVRIRKVLPDAFDNRFIIPDLQELPPADRARFSSFAYW